MLTKHMEHFLTRTLGEKPQPLKGHVGQWLAMGTTSLFDTAVSLTCEPGKSALLQLSPTRSMYAKVAARRGVTCRSVTLNAERFTLDIDTLLDAITADTSLVVLCNPNFPTGNLLAAEAVSKVLDLFDGLVVVDESYIDYTPDGSVAHLCEEYGNLLVMRSMSHAWAAADARLAVGIARSGLLTCLRHASATGDVSPLLAEHYKQLLRRSPEMRKRVNQTVDERNRVAAALQQLPLGQYVHPSSADFILMRLPHAQTVYHLLLAAGVDARQLSYHTELPQLLCIHIGLPHENARILSTLRGIQPGMLKTKVK